MGKKSFTPISDLRKGEYKKTYDRLMLRASSREFNGKEHEKHHIVPRSFGGSDRKENIAYLTFREHFLAHWLLIKFTEGDYKRKMGHALVRMTGKSKNNLNKIVAGWQYAVAKQVNVAALLGNTYSKGNFAGDKNPSRRMSKEKIKERTEAAVKTRKINKKACGDNHPFKRAEVKALISGENCYSARAVINLNTLKVFGTLNFAGSAYNVNPTCIKDACKGRQKTSAKCKWAYLDSLEGYLASVFMLKRKKLLENAV